jgi:hypothetical protein
MSSSASTANNSVMDETTPLLPPAETSEGRSTAQEAEAAEDDKPLPMGQILLLCYARFVDPIAYFSIFPFLTRQIKSSGIAETDVGFYAGLIVGLVRPIGELSGTDIFPGIRVFNNPDDCYDWMGSHF